MNADSLSMTESRNGEICVLSISGRIDSSNAGAFMARLGEIISSGVKTILIDLASVMYLTSAAFRALLVANRDIGAKSGRLALCRVVGQVRDLFEMGGLLNVFTIYPSRDEALSKLG
jgi:stage II sporulation protein AA (anti-sigma F factor antagonist)